jgi:Type II secretion system (T2SS), protein F
MNTGVFHSLGTVVFASAAAVCAVDAVTGARRSAAARRRMRRLLGAEQPRPGAPAIRRRLRVVLRAWVPPLAVGLASATLVGGLAGWVTGPAVGYGMHRWRRRPRPGSDAAPDDARRLPLAADLMAACLAAGAGPREAAEAVGCSLGGPLGEALKRAAAELRLGGDPSGCWGRFQPRELGRCLERASTTGVPPVEEVSRLAAVHRAEQARAALTRARRAGVLATGPLGLCFLPAFLLVGVAPVVMGLAGAIFAGAPK